MRGNHLPNQRVPRPGGSIPARAGEPPNPPSNPPCREVYPRACGGTSPSRNAPYHPSGLSPRVRGNRHRRRHSIQQRRSIPARAGEPAVKPISLSGFRVYPRACGGTVYQRHGSRTPVGLSPRVRGNHRQPDHRAHAVRSIPARAGEPGHDYSSSSRGSVYPRACGGTSNTLHSSHIAAGLSPRVRGNLPAAACSPTHVRSIPARAGEPR